MFTGIIQKTALVTRLEKSNESLRLAITAPWTGLTLGESIAVNGVCLTATEFSHDAVSAEDEIYFFVGFETLNRSNLRDIKKGAIVNLERAIRASEGLSGHIVQGHVDGEGRFLDAQLRGESWDVRFELSADLAKYCINKGSISLNGVSLTLAQVQEQSDGSAIISIMLIPYTWEHTNLSRLKTGSTVNVEVDVLAKYMEKLCQPYFKQLKI
jgi:riboflavin synthase